MTMKLRNRNRAKVISQEWDAETLGLKTLWTTLPDPLWEGAYSYRHQIRTGEYLLAIYFQPLAGRWIIKIGSLWEDRANPGCIIGDRFELRSPEDILALIEAMGLEFELKELLPLLREEAGK